MLRVMLKRAANLLHRLGLGPDRTWTRLFPADARFEPHLESIVQRVRPFTMTSRQRIRGLCRALAYLERQHIAGVNGAAFTIGGVRDILTRRGFESGIGVAVTLHAMPALLDPFYGAHPVGFQVFFRLRRAEHVLNMQ